MTNFLAVYDEIKQMRTMCGEKVHLKTIIATGELITNENIYKASMTAILGGRAMFHLFD